MTYVNGKINNFTFLKILGVVRYYKNFLIDESEIRTCLKYNKTRF